jgi:hypothetical protein
VNGDPDLLIRARTALLDALEALAVHREAVVVIGAQAIYLRTGGIAVPLPEMTKDSDLAIDPRSLGQEPLIEELMCRAGFVPRPDRPQPGTWLNAAGIPVDLMVPEALAGEGGRRGARVPPHSDTAMRRASGLEAAVVDRSRMRLESLTADDDRIFDAWVAGPAALLVSKLHKIAEREGQPDRLNDKDAHDIYRLLFGVPTAESAATFEWLRADPVAGAVTQSSLVDLERLFARGASALGSLMAGRAESGVGTPEVVSASAAALAGDLLERLDRG